MNVLIKTLSNQSNPLTQLIGVCNTKEALKSIFVGYAYRLSYDTCCVQTNDSFKRQVGGIPHNSFLVAASFNPYNMEQSHHIDHEVLLLRTLEPIDLPQDGDMIRTRLEHHQRRIEDELLPLHENDGLDPLTASELQWGGMRCRVVGTFYLDKDGSLKLGSDLENYMSNPRMRIYKPKGKALELIVNHLNPEVRQKSLEESIKSGFSEAPSPINIGTVRYTSTARLHRRDHDQLVPVYIQPADFLSRRTAVLGMTRTGKSNTVKTTVSSVAMAALKSKIKVGQLIFDINGEYANANHQDDGSSIAEVFGEHWVKRYRAIDTPGFGDLRINFYEEPETAILLLDEISKDMPRNAQDIMTFFSTSLEAPNEYGDFRENQRRSLLRAAFYCVLHKAKYQAPEKFPVRFFIDRNLYSSVSSKLEKFPSYSKEVNGTYFYTLSLDDATRWFEFLRQTNLTNPILDSKKLKWVDLSLEAMLNVLCKQNNSGTQIRGYTQIQEYTPYHSPKRQGNVIDEITAHLYDGKIIILDMSAGPVSIRKTLSNRIARAVFKKQFEDLHKGKTPMNVVLYVEEAHNIIGKEDDLQSIWPRIAKEGAKAKIAFVYATQEPSSIHKNILANTENWFVSHLNNDDELRTLGKFYDFGDFLPSLKSAQDVGFARIKTLSTPFVIPTQINRFTPEELKKEMEHYQIGPFDPSVLYNNKTAAQIESMPTATNDLNNSNESAGNHQKIVETSKNRWVR